MPSLADIDRQLADLRAAETMVTTNLVALDEHPAYKLLSAAKDSMTGVTAERAKPALQAMQDLWQHFTMLSDLVDRADKVRGTSQRVPDDKLDELDELLNGHSVPLARREVPLAQRGLLSSSHVDEAITPQDLLTAMTNAFEAARDVVVAADAAWSKLLPALDAANAEIDSLGLRAADLGMPEPGELALARAAVGPITTRVANDPLGADADFEALTRGHLKAAQTSIELREAERAEVQEGVPAARQQVNEIGALIARGAEAVEFARTKILRPSGLVEPLTRAGLDDEVTGLVAGLARMQALVSQRAWHAAAGELSQWRKTAAALEADARRIADANEGPVRRRNELRGLLDASKAKANAVGLAENSDVDNVYDAAHAALHTTPCDLASAEALVTEHLAAVRALTNPSRPEANRRQA